jgi:hypothetical protein
MSARMAAGGLRALLLMAIVVASTAAPARASVVLLDEFWSPEITATDVKATEVDTEATGDPTQAVAGYYSARLENTTGAPNVRFRNAASLRPTDLPPDQTEARLWYRTDKWNGKWALEVWLFVPSAKRPVQMLTTELDGGGEDGRLIADNHWHQAKGLLKKGPEYDVAAGAAPVPANSYVMLHATEGWDIAHTTYVDRVEAVVVAGPGKEKPMQPPTRHVRPVPGFQTDGPGVVCFEGEDAVESTFQPGSAYLPDNAAEQRLLSNGAWLQPGAPGATAAWKFTVPAAGSYAVWTRGFWYRGGFRWRVDGGDWKTSGPDRKYLSAVDYRQIDEKAWGLPAVTVGWAPLGSVDLAAGQHSMETQCSEDALGVAFDCWALSRSAFEQ